MRTDPLPAFSSLRRLASASDSSRVGKASTRTSAPPPGREVSAPWVLSSSSPPPGLAANALVLHVAYVTPAVVEEHWASEDGRVLALLPDCYFQNRHELLAAPRAPVVNHVLSLSQPSAPVLSCNGTSIAAAGGQSPVDRRIVSTGAVGTLPRYESAFKANTIGMVTKSPIEGGSQARCSRGRTRAAINVTPR
jgi:hypothetical protein